MQSLEIDGEVWKSLQLDFRLNLFDNEIAIYFMRKY